MIGKSGFTVCDDLLHGFIGGYLPPVLGTHERPSGPIPDLVLKENMAVVLQPSIVTKDGKAGVQTGERCASRGTASSACTRRPGVSDALADEPGAARGIWYRAGRAMVMIGRATRGRRYGIVVQPNKGGYGMDQKIINLYDKFTHGGMNRRQFMDELAKVAGSTAAAMALLPLLQNDYAKAQIVPANDARLNAEKISYDFPKGKVSGYLVRPKGTVKRPAVVVIHENRGLNPHIEDVARRLATEGFLALAPDLLSVSGGTPANEDAARDLHSKTNREDMIVEAVAGVAFLKAHAESTSKVGAVGFCFGGGVVNRIATDSPVLDAGVAYYGAQVPADKVPAIKAALLLQYAENDDNINKGIADFEAALKANNKKYTKYMYPGTQHAFNNDTGGARYNKAAADLAWSRTLAFFRETLGVPPHVG